MEGNTRRRSSTGREIGVLTAFGGGWRQVEANIPALPTALTFAAGGLLAGGAGRGGGGAVTVVCGGYKGGRNDIGRRVKEGAPIEVCRRCD